MKLITVEATFAADKIEAAISEFDAQIEAVRAMDGCDSYALYRSGDTVAIVQRWQDMARFDAYRKSDEFAGLGAALKPLMSAPPVTTIARVDNT
ncbi:putative quinol monooxygenase [Roseobacteraceae bacterium S113]